MKATSYELRSRGASSEQRCVIPTQRIPSIAPSLTRLVFAKTAGRSYRPWAPISERTNLLSLLAKGGNSLEKQVGQSSCLPRAQPETDSQVCLWWTERLSPIAANEPAPCSLRDLMKYLPAGLHSSMSSPSAEFAILPTLPTHHRRNATQGNARQRKRSSSPVAKPDRQDCRSGLTATEADSTAGSVVRSASAQRRGAGAARTAAQRSRQGNQDKWFTP